MEGYFLQLVNWSHRNPNSLLQSDQSPKQHLSEWEVELRLPQTTQEMCAMYHSYSGLCEQHPVQLSLELGSVMEGRDF